MHTPPAHLHRLRTLMRTVSIKEQLLSDIRKKHTALKLSRTHTHNTRTEFQERVCMYVCMYVYVCMCVCMCVCVCVCV